MTSPRAPDDPTAGSKTSTNPLVLAAMTLGDDKAAGSPTTDRPADPEADRLAEPAMLDPGSEDVATAGEGLRPFRQPRRDQPSSPANKAASYGSGLK
jgi:hypothetical protein